MKWLPPTLNIFQPWKLGNFADWNPCLIVWRLLVPAILNMLIVRMHDYADCLHTICFFVVYQAISANMVDNLKHV